MIPPLLLWVASLLLRVLSAIARPTHVDCAPWYVEGVRPAGDSWCVRPPDGRGDDECIARGRCKFVDDKQRIPVRVWCTRGRPRVISASGIACVGGGESS